MKTKPSLAPPDQYVEIGLWKQVMQVNQQICHKMELLDKIAEQDCPDKSEVLLYNCELSNFFSPEYFMYMKHYMRLQKHFCG